MINEPTAARPWLYGLDNEKEQKIMVYDLGAVQKLRAWI
ncbi:MAG: Hsp70 family protein [Clostridium sp.]